MLFFNLQIVQSAEQDRLTEEQVEAAVKAIKFEEDFYTGSSKEDLTKFYTE